MRAVSRLATLFAIGASIAAVSGHAATLKGHELASQATISLAKARTIALAARAGTVHAQELEKEKGGSGLRYSFDILSSGKTYEVGVDARTGAVLENGVESKKD